MICSCPLGEFVSGLSHLARDTQPVLLQSRHGGRIWTEAAHIEKRLAEVSEHMENVFQAYLRNEFETIEEYNRHAGEVAEPYHFVIVANFPANDFRRKRKKRAWPLKKLGGAAF